MTIYVLYALEVGNKLITPFFSFQHGIRTTLSPLPIPIQPPNPDPVRRHLLPMHSLLIYDLPTSPELLFHKEHRRTHSWDEITFFTRTSALVAAFLANTAVVAFGPVALLADPHGCCSPDRSARHCRHLGWCGHNPCCLACCLRKCRLCRGRRCRPPPNRGWSGQHGLGPLYPWRCGSPPSRRLGRHGHNRRHVHCRRRRGSDQGHPSPQPQAWSPSPPSP
jgi:hypothetical protein